MRSTGCPPLRGVGGFGLPPPSLIRTKRPFQEALAAPNTYDAYPPSVNAVDDAKWGMDDPSQPGDAKLGDYPTAEREVPQTLNRRLPPTQA